MLPTRPIVDLLDKAFRVPEVGDPHLAKHALTDDTRKFATPAFLAEKTGLMFDFTEVIERVYCVVFTTPKMLSRLLEIADAPSLLFTHHPHDYHEDRRGFDPFPQDYVRRLQQSRTSVYTIHTPLDVGLNISVSKSLAERLSLSDPMPFCEALGGHLGVAGWMGSDNLRTTADQVAYSLGISTIDVFDNNGGSGLTAVVAGGGDQASILAEARELGCTRYVTGTVVHRWALEFIQARNAEFHAAAREGRIDLIGASHYHTEKCALEDVAAYLRQHGVDATFLDDPVLGTYDCGNWRP